VLVLLLVSITLLLLQCHAVTQAAAGLGSTGEL
jgi:hypothetical protein